MIETTTAREKRIKAEASDRAKRAADYAAKMGTPLAEPSSIAPVMERAFEIDESKPITALTVRAIETQINRYLDGAERLLLIIHRTEGWRVAGFDSMAAWAKAKINVSKSRAYQLIGYAETTSAIAAASPQIVDLPTHESQTRPMRGLTDKRKATAWKRATKAANGAQPTAKQVTDAVAAMKPAKATEIPAEVNEQGVSIIEPPAWEKSRTCPHCHQPLDMEPDQEPQ